MVIEDLCNCYKLVCALVEFAIRDTVCRSQIHVVGMMHSSRALVCGPVMQRLAAWHGRMEGYAVNLSISSPQNRVQLLCIMP